MNERWNRREIFRAGAAAATLAAVGIVPGTSVQGQPARRMPPRGGSRIDPRDVQVLFADLQVSLVPLSTTTAPAGISRAAGVLAKVASVLRMPALFSVVPERGDAPTLIPELRPFATTANTIPRTPVSPFHDAPTAAALARSGRRTLVIAGFATEAVVLQAALDAIAAGYTVFHAVDAMGSPSARGEEAALRVMERAGATPTSVLGLATRLVNDFVGSPGAETFAAIQPLLHP